MTHRNPFAGWSRARVVDAILCDRELLAELDARRTKIALGAALPGVLNTGRAMSTREVADALSAAHPETWPNPGALTPVLVAIARAGSPYAERGAEEENAQGDVFKRWLWLGV